MIYYDNNKIIGKAYKGTTPVRKMYGGTSLSFNNGIESLGGAEPTPPVPTPEYQYAIVNDIANYSDTDYIDVYDRKTMKWYKLNNLNQYEEYGKYGDSRQNTYYVGKLVVEGNSEYEWNGTEWVYVGEATTIEDFYAPTDEEIMDAGYSNDLCESGFTEFRFTIDVPSSSRIRLSNIECSVGRINVTENWEVGVIYNEGMTLYIPRGGAYDIMGCGFEFGNLVEIYAKEYAVKQRPVFAKAYDTIALAEADITNVGLNAAAVLPNNDVYTFSSNGLVATPHYKMIGRLSGITECLYEPSTTDKTVTSGWTTYLDNTKLETVIIDDATTVNSYAFYGCNHLSSAVIGSGITSIGTYIFYNCSSLTSISAMSMTAATVNTSSFYLIKTGGTLSVPRGATGYDVWMGTANYYLGLYGWTLSKIPAPYERWEADGGIICYDNHLYDREVCYYSYDNVNWYESDDYRPTGEAGGICGVPQGYRELTYLRVPKNNNCTTGTPMVPYDLQVGYKYEFEFTPASGFYDNFYACMFNGQDGSPYFPEIGVYKTDNGWGGETGRTIAAFCNMNFDTRKRTGMVTGGTPGAYRFYVGKRCKMTFQKTNSSTNLTVENEGYETVNTSSTKTYSSGYNLTYGRKEMLLLGRTQNYTAPIDFHAFRVYDSNNSLIWEYLPVERTSDGNIGIFETMHQQYYTLPYTATKGGYA